MIISNYFFYIQLEAKQVIPPYRPKIENDRDLEHFDPTFTTEPVCLTPDDPRMIEELDQSEFDGFEYVSVGFLQDIFQ